MKLVALDIETKCARDCEVSCECALFPNKSKISVVGVWTPEFEAVFRNLEELQKFLDENPEFVFVGHNFKFDLRHLHYHGVHLPPERWAHDTQNMASVCLKKVSDKFLETYEKLRVEKNKELPKGYSHRKAKGKSLKTLAPFFLGVEPFWENPANHDSDEYVLKDCCYTYKLYEVLRTQMESEGSWAFYESKLKEWSKTLLQAEERGILLDKTRLERKEKVAQAKMSRAKKKLDELWGDAYHAWKILKVREIFKKYEDKKNKALTGSKDPKKTEAKYEKLRETCIEKADLDLDLNSPKQVLWLLRDYLKLDTGVRVRDKETNVITEEDSTGVEVLQRLAGTRDDIKWFLEYREQSKLCQAFFPSYRDLVYPDGSIKTSLNADGTRTGRLSSSNPNMQQVSGDLHSLFRARPGYELLCFDESAIEARLIAYFSEDEVLCELIKHDRDLHSFHAQIFFETSEPISKKDPKRQLAKNIGFGLFYGAGPNRIKQEALKLGYKWDDSHCLRLFKKFKKTYSQVFSYKENQDRDAEDCIQLNLFSRPFSFPNVEDIYMKNFNTLIQGSASDLVLASAHNIQRKFDAEQIDGHLLLLVHDEVIFEVAKHDLDRAEDIVKKELTNWPLKTQHGIIPLKVEGGRNLRWTK